ncbi:DUF4400 domain-containing protein [Succinivibrio dextrinosolvens]|jgi:hypothetical protein|uniref:DUF4400 domain-containing protein n=1 Tax=Succinivibrio dextrinosolvens TaxID=83771 RepID=UPI00241C57C3|nr:DUF4400 domain-containing protein [Succinivibrio dextrinosolvens]MBE6423084.1 DUF4400 domain-containing protein [Succinivibrio dextrinosolvens]
MKTKSWGKTCLVIFILELLLLVTFMTPEAVTRVMAMEGVKIENTLGTETLRELDKRTSESFNSLVIESGAYADMWHTLIPTEDEKAKSGRLKDTGKGLFRWIEDRLNVCMFLFFQFLERFHLMGLWFPSSVLIFMASVYSGLILRKIKQGSFAFSSPTAHRSGIRTILIMVTLLPLYFMFPSPITPYLYPVLNIIWAFMLMTIIANIAKRI